MKYLLTLIIFYYSFNSLSQTIDPDALAPAIEDVKQFSEKFYRPGTNAIVHAMSSGWFNSAKVKDKWKLDFRIVGNVTLADTDSQRFLFRESDYNSTRLVSGATEQNVSTILGENDPDVSVFVGIVNPNGGEDIDIELRLPNGIAQTVNFMPSAFLQASIGLGEGFEVKARYLPTFNYQDVDARFLGFAVQNEITEWMNFKEDFPFHISALIGYTNFEGFYGFTESDKIDDLDGRINSKAQSWLFTGIVSTSYPKLNFYGSLGYVVGDAETITSTTGVYTISRPSGDVDANINIEPYTVNTSTDGARITLGVDLKLGKFNVFSDFSLQEFSTASIGLNYNIN